MRDLRGLESLQRALICSVLSNSGVLQEAQGDLNNVDPRRFLCQTNLDYFNAYDATICLSYNIAIR